MNELRLCGVCDFSGPQSGSGCEVCTLRQQLEQATKERDAAVAIANWAQAVLTALNVGDVKSGSPMHLKLREVMITSRQAV